MSKQVGILDWHEPKSAHPRSWMRYDDAERLLTRLFLEKIRQGVYRRVPPGFAGIKHVAKPEKEQIDRLTAREVGNCRFIPPKSARTSQIPRTHYLPRFRPVFGDRLLEISLAPKAEGLE